MAPNNPPPAAPPMPKAARAYKKPNPKKACRNLSAGSVTKRYLDDNKYSSEAKDILDGLQDNCERTDGCTFNRTSAKCKPVKGTSRVLADLYSNAYYDLSHKVDKLEKKARKAKKKRSASKAKARSRSASPRRRSASPAKKSGTKLTLPAMRKKGIPNLTKDELIEFIKRTRVAVAKASGKRVTDVAALPAGLTGKTKAQLVTIARQWNNKL